MKIIFVGTPRFSEIILQKLIEADYRPVLVITETDKPAGRDNKIQAPEVKLLAKKENIPVLQPEKIKDCEKQLKLLEPDLIILASYGQIIPKNILDIPRLGAINVHPSLLPKYRGASPVQAAILNGDKETGATIYQMDEKMDHGPILIKDTFPLRGDETTDRLKEELADFGAGLLLEILPIIEKEEANALPQSEEQATYAKILKKEDGHIDWKKPAVEIERQIRAFHPWPASFTFWKKDGTNMLRLKVVRAEAKDLPNDQNYPFGKAVASPENELLVLSGAGFLKILELQLEGKNPMGAEDFLKGHKDIIGAVLE